MPDTDMLKPAMRKAEVKRVREGSILLDLHESELFLGLSSDELEEIACFFVEIEVPTESYVFREGDVSDALYIVRQGTVIVFRDTIGMPMQSLAQLRPGQFFGEMGLLCEVERSASVRSTEPCKVLRIERDDFLTLLQKHPVLLRKIQMTAAQRHSANMASTLELGRRREVRIRFHHEVTLELEDETACRATLENLSLGGLCLRGAPRDWQEKEDVRFGLGLKVGKLPLAGRVAWRQTGLPQGDAIGMCFNKISTNHDKMIQMAIHLLLEISPLQT